MSAPGDSEAPLDSLDFLYMPSRDVVADLAFYRDVLGGEVVFAIEAFGARVAQVRLSPDEPRLLLADHLEGDAAVLVYRVADLEAALAELERRGLTIEARFGIPHGPCAAIRTPGGQRLALYELTRPGADQRLEGRLDFGGAGRPPARRRRRRGYAGAWPSSTSMPRWGRSGCRPRSAS